MPRHRSRTPQAAIRTPPHIAFLLFAFSLLAVVILPLQAHADNLGLVGYWSFDDATGTQATDFSGNGNTGTLTNNPTWTSGKHGKALSFDGSTNYVIVSDASNLRLASGGTVSAWIKPIDFGANGKGRIVDKSTDTIHSNGGSVRISR